MRVEETKLSGVLLIDPQLHTDSRGYFLQLWNMKECEEHDLPQVFVQDNLSYSTRGVLRGLHFQNPRPQGKLVTVLQGEVLDVVVDVRTGSASFGMWESFVLSHKNKRQIYIPHGFAHGFVVRSESASFYYKCTDFYDSKSEISLIWNDPDIAINWEESNPILSPKDRSGVRLKDIPGEKLFNYSKLV